jgi:hypothetical protein
MKNLCKFFATVGIAWAILIHPFLFLQAIRGEQTRKIHALAAVTQDWMSSDHATNGVITIPADYAKIYMQRTQEIAETHDRHSVMFWIINWISSAIIIVLSIGVLSACKKKEQVPPK